MKIGYTTISITKQRLGLQKEVLENSKCDKIYEVVLSVAKHKRSGLNLALEVLKSSGVLVV